MLPQTYCFLFCLVLLGKLHFCFASCAAHRLWQWRIQKEDWRLTKGRGLCSFLHCLLSESTPPKQWLFTLEVAEVNSSSWFCFWLLAPDCYQHHWLASYSQLSESQVLGASSLKSLSYKPQIATCFQTSSFCSIAFFFPAGGSFLLYLLPLWYFQVPIFLFLILL